MHELCEVADAQQIPPVEGDEAAEEAQMQDQSAVWG